MVLPNCRGASVALRKLGETVEIYEKVEVGKDDFNKTEFDWEFVRTANCTVTYGGDNDEVRTSNGEYNSNNPTFYFAKGDEPSNDARVKRVETDGLLYELQTFTKRRSQTKVRGAKVNE